MKRDYKVTKQMKVNEYIVKYVNNTLLQDFWNEARKWDNTVTIGTFYQIGIMNIWLDQAEGK